MLRIILHLHVICRLSFSNFETVDMMECGEFILSSVFTFIQSFSSAAKNDKLIGSLTFLNNLAR